MQFRKIEPQKVFVGRESQLEWFERLIFSHEHWHSPFFVVGPPGVGKSALVARFMEMISKRATPLWFNASDNTSIDEAELEFESRIRAGRDREREHIIVILDDAHPINNGEFGIILKRILNHKLVRAVIVTSRTEPTIGRAPVLRLAPLASDDAEALFKRLISIELSQEIVDQVVVRSGGNPAIIHLFSGVVNTSGVEGLTQVFNGPLYSVTDTIPRGKIIAVAKPQLIIVTSSLLDELKKQPESVYDLPPRKFEELLAELLHDQGVEVELTQATRDGGRDILAHYDTPVGRILCLIDAKRYRRDRTVGVGLVRQLHGTLCDHKATNAMMVTTSTYSPDAHAYQQRHKYQLSLKDYSDVVTWIQEYKQKSNSALIYPS